LHDGPLDNRKCPYCDRVYRYPSILKRHLRLKNVCSEQANRVSDRASRVSDQISQTSDRVSEKNTIPIRLSLV
jgi:hypothetical protein